MLTAQLMLITLELLVILCFGAAAIIWIGRTARRMRR